MLFRRFALLSVSTVALMAGGHAARAADETLTASTTNELVVTSDRVGLLERRPNNTVFGLDKPLIDTPRSASLISDLTIQRYGIQTIDNLVAIAPGTFTASFYGVPGSLNISPG